MLIIRAPLLFKTSAPDVVEKLLPRYTRLVQLDLVGFQLPRSLGDGRKYSTNRETVSTQCKVQSTENIFQMQTVGLVKRSIQQVFGDFKTNEIVIRLRRVVTAGNLQDIEAELCLQVRCVIVRVRHFISELLLQLWEKDGHCSIDGYRI